MGTCAKCGNALAVGRFCVHCGHPVDASGSTDTAERPAVLGPVSPTAVAPTGAAPTGAAPTAGAPTAGAPRVPPPVLESPQQARFPLYADQSAHHPAPAGPPAEVPPSGGHHRDPPEKPAWLPWALVGIVLVLIAVLGGVLLLEIGTGNDEPVREPAAAGSTTPSPDESQPSTTPTPTPTPSQTPSEAGPPENVARSATAAVPGTAPPNQDVDGNLVRYEARNMLDEVPTSCWRIPGDASGQTITITLEGPTTLSSVGLVNGYAKVSEAESGTLDWYRGNRRVLAVEWTFDDGTTESQSLAQTRDMQSIAIEPVVTSTVTLRLLSVSSPGAGRSGRDYTAISDLSLVGSPAP